MIPAVCGSFLMKQNQVAFLLPSMDAPYLEKQSFTLCQSTQMPGGNQEEILVQASEQMSLKAIRLSEISQSKDKCMMPLT